MHIFYTPDISPATASFQLDEDESKHCIRVLRLAKGDTIVLVDGKGGRYEAVIANDNAKRCEVNIVKYTQQATRDNQYVHLAIAPTKNIDRMEWLVEKAVEIGIDEISLIQSNHSERGVVKTERLIKVAVSAMKQSMKAHLPLIHEMLSFEKFLQLSVSFDGQKFIAHCNDTATPKQHLKELCSKGNAMIMIGPEGDFSMEEVNKALNNGFKEISLGSSRLRTETAALYAITVINIMNE